MKFTALVAIVASLSELSLAAPTSGAQAGAVIPGSYIITLKPDAHAKRHIEWVTALHEEHLSKRANAKDIKKLKGVEKTIDDKSGFQAYTGSFDSKTVKEIKKNPDVAVVEQDRVWKISTMVHKSLGDEGEIMVPESEDEEDEEDPEEHEVPEDEDQDDSFRPPRVPITVIDKRAMRIQANTVWGLASISHRSKLASDYLYDDKAGTGTFAYVLDTGVRTTHNEFAGRAQKSWTNWKNNFNDENGHGTHVAGIIAGKSFGVAKKAVIRSVKVFKGSESTTSILLSGYSWAVNDIITKKIQNKAVINLSVGGSFSAAFNNAIQAAAKSQVLTVVAAGNENVDASTTSPASAPNAITVGAVNSKWNIADYSNWGKSVDLFAPGSEITSAGSKSNSATVVMSGTSMASPYVAGIALYAMSINNVKGVSSLTTWIKNQATKKCVTGKLRSSPNLLANNGNKKQ